MDKAKIDAAVVVMKSITPEERAVVNYTVDREARKRGPRRKGNNNETLLLATSDSDAPKTNNGNRVDSGISTAVGRASGVSEAPEREA